MRELTSGRRPKLAFRVSKRSQNQLLLVVIGFLFVPLWTARAHDISLELRDVHAGVEIIERTLRAYRHRSPLPEAPRTEPEQRRALGEAEVEKALGHSDRALRILLGRLADPRFRAMPESIDALLLASEVLERKGDYAGAMAFAREALETGRTPQQMAEAGARWFRLARRTRRLGDRLRLYELWRAKGGSAAAGTEESAQVMYEVGFALRAQGRNREARRFLASVPSESGYGSRAAFLAGTLFIQDGDLAQAERWFSAIMDWALPNLSDEHPQMEIEREVRSLSALSTARLRYERGDLEAAATAYQRVPAHSRYRREACWELAFLESERKRERSALKHVRCVEAFGAPGSRSVDLKLLRSSLLAHVSRYAASIEAYEAVHREVVGERDLIAKTFQRLTAPSEFLFSGMERTAADVGWEATPGPATLVGEAWTPQVALAYRVDRGLGEAAAEVETLLEEVRSISNTLRRKDAFEPLELRRQSLQRLLLEIDHLAGHAGQMEFSVKGRHASLGLAIHNHRSDTNDVRSSIQRLNRLRSEVKKQLAEIEREAAARKAEALRRLGEISEELAELRDAARELRDEAVGPVNAAAREALIGIVARLDDAAMRAEVGVLDTFWLKKQHRTRAVERLLDAQKEAEEHITEALRDLER